MTFPIVGPVKISKLILAVNLWPQFLFVISASKTSADTQFSSKKALSGHLVNITSRASSFMSLSYGLSLVFPLPSWLALQLSLWFFQQNLGLDFSNVTELPNTGPNIIFVISAAYFSLKIYCLVKMWLWYNDFSYCLKVGPKIIVILPWKVGLQCSGCHFV